jgi:hypothetical protein
VNDAAVRRQSRAVTEPQREATLPASTTSPRTSHRSRRLFMLCVKSHRSPSPLRLLSAVDHACCGCSVVNALTTPSLRYQSPAVYPRRDRAAARSDSPRLHHLRNLFCLPGQKRFLLLFCEDEYDKIITTNRDFEEDKHRENHRYLN